jgi:hypothetical protein
MAKPIQAGRPATPVPLGVLLVALTAAFAIVAVFFFGIPKANSADAGVREWTRLNGKPLQNPFDPTVIRTVVHRFSILPSDVADELAEKVIAGRGRPSTICKGDLRAHMSFGDMEVWGPTRVAWTNVRGSRACKPTTVFETVREETVYAVERVHACKNLDALYPRRGSAPPPPTTGPILGRIPPVECPPTVVGQCC